MDIATATPLLGGLSPQAFMRRHWQKKPLLVRQAVPGGVSLVTRTEMFALAARDDVESRLVVRDGIHWSMRQGPLPRRALPSLKQPAWTLLLQGLDLHLPAAHELLARFRFVPDARLDDAMFSFATDGGGVGPHVDSYDVFLLQVQGRRRWRIGRLRDRTLVPGVPLKILARFDAEQAWILEPGDMLYLPPGWAHDGAAEGECMTCSIGFRAARRHELGTGVLQRLLDGADAPPAGAADPLYRDAGQPATGAPGRVPEALHAFARGAVARLVAEPDALARALGEWLSEPKPGVWFEPPGAVNAFDAAAAGVALDRKTRMLYDERHLFVNGESFRGSGRDVRLMRQLADRRSLTARECSSLSDEARELLAQWADDGWLHAAPSAV